MFSGQPNKKVKNGLKLKHLGLSNRCWRWLATTVQNWLS